MQNGMFVKVSTELRKKIRYKQKSWKKQTKAVWIALQWFQGSAFSPVYVNSPFVCNANLLESSPEGSHYILVYYDCYDWGVFIFLWFIMTVAVNLGKGKIIRYIGSQKGLVK